MRPGRSVPPKPKLLAPGKQAVKLAAKPDEKKPASLEEMNTALERLGRARQAAIVDSRGKDLELLDSLQARIEEALDVLGCTNLRGSKPRDLVYVLSQLMDMREKLLGFDTERQESKQRSKTRFQFAFDMTSGQGAISVEGN